MEWTSQEVYNSQNIDRREVSIGFSIKPRFVFDVKYTNDAEIYFGVALYYNYEIAEII